MTTGYFKSFDDNKLFYRKWNYSPTKKTLIILHRGHEHSERLNDFATSYLLEEYNIFAYDLRGHGYTKAEVSPVFMDYVRDLEYFKNYLFNEYAVKEEDIFVIANSIAGVIVTAWIHDFAPKISGMALIAPAFEIKLYVPFANELIGLTTRLKKDLIIQSYVKAKVLTHDPEQQKAYNSDRLISKSINGKLLVDLQKAGKRIVEDAGAIDIPTLILSAEKDFVVKNSVQKDFYVRIESDVKEFITLPDFYHGILFEKDKEIAYHIIKNFLPLAYNHKKEESSLKAETFTSKEYEKLSLKVMPITEKLNYDFQKWALGKIGRLSKGMSLGLKYGFDSGISLDYVYKNTPKGKNLLGKIIDKGYLEAIGWKGIRIRKEHLLAILDKRIQEIQESGRKVKILDIAGGTGNYLFDVKKKYPDTEIVINEFILDNIKIGEKTIEKNDFTDIRFTNHSCFEPDTYKLIDFEPNITIISGIFELFSDNELINQAIQGIISISDQNSFLIYTGQPWHPQLKMIAYVLNSHQKKDWIMRRRSQKELDNIMEYNGIEKDEMLIDDFGIFTVSTGRIK